jgi:hypothetical protein
MTQDEIIEMARQAGEWQSTQEKSKIETVPAQGTLLPQRTWVRLMRGVRVEGDTVVISVHYGNDSARQVCGALIEEMNK